MGKIIGYLLLTLIIVIATFVLLIFMLSDLTSARRYKAANRCQGKVVNQLDDLKINAYGGGVFGVGKRKYRQYQVAFVVDGEYVQGIVHTKKKNLKYGDSIEVRYFRDKKTDEIKIATRVYLDRLRELQIAIILAVVFVGIVIWLR